MYEHFIVTYCAYSSKENMSAINLSYEENEGQLLYIYVVLYKHKKGKLTTDLPISSACHRL